jgi:hypothetical protein
MKRTILYLLASLVVLLTQAPSVRSQWIQTFPPFYVAHFAGCGGKVLAGTVNGLIVSKDNGKVWDTVGYNIRGFVRSIFSDNRSIFVTTDSEVYRSLDSGLTWEFVLSLYHIGSGQGEAVFGLIVLIGNMRSTDKGNSWTAMPDIHSVVAFPTVNGVLYALTSNDGIFRSRDSGATWEHISKGLSGLNVVAVTVLGSEMFANVDMGSYYYLFHSVDSGVTWIKGNSVGDITALITIGNNLVSGGANSSVSMSTDKGESWVTIGKMFHYVNSIAVVGPSLFAGTNSQGLWRRPLSDFRNISSNIPLQNGLALTQNYPNPFSSLTSISFSNERREFVDVQIVDVLGKQCAQLFSGEANAGKHSYEWNATSMTAGVYFFTVRTENGIAQMPMIVQH